MLLSKKRHLNAKIDLIICTIEVNWHTDDLQRQLKSGKEEKVEEIPSNLHRRWFSIAPASFPHLLRTSQAGCIR